VSPTLPSKVTSFASGALNAALGVVLIFAGTLTLAGVDRVLQIALLGTMPGWMVWLTTGI